MIEVKLAKFPLVIPSKQIIIAIRVIGIDTMHTITLRIFILLKILISFASFRL